MYQAASLTTTNVATRT